MGLTSPTSQSLGFFICEMHLLQLQIQSNDSDANHLLSLPVCHSHWLGRAALRFAGGVEGNHTRRISLLSLVARVLRARTQL